MFNLVINPVSSSQLQSYIKNPSHGLLLSGPIGIGLDTVASEIALKVANQKAHVSHILPDKSGITIEQVRELYISTRTKSNSPRVVILHDVDSMTVPAQNAFLKLLEEPPKSTYFILTSHFPRQILPTICSRVQSIDLLPINLKSSEALLDPHSLTSVIKKQILFIAAGLPAELIRLSEDQMYRQATFAVASEAKRFLSGTRFEKLSSAARIANDRQQALTTLALACKMCQFNLKSQPDLHLVSLLEAMLQAREAITANGNVKAQLLGVCFTH